MATVLKGKRQIRVPTSCSGAGLGYDAHPSHLSYGVTNTMARWRAVGVLVTWPVMMGRSEPHSPGAAALPAGHRSILLRRLEL